MSGSGEFISVIPVLGNKPERIELGDGSSRRRVPLHYDGRTNPRVVRGFLEEASPDYNEKRFQRLQGRNEWRGAIVTVNTGVLDFSSARSTHLPGINNAWPGVEQEHFLFSRTDDNRHQLVAVEEGEFCFVCDSRKRYMRILCRDGVVATAPAVPRELARCFVIRAENTITTHKGLLWTRKALEALGFVGLWTDELETRLASFPASHQRRR